MELETPGQRRSQWQIRCTCAIGREKEDKEGSTQHKFCVVGFINCFTWYGSFLETAICVHAKIKNDVSSCWYKNWCPVVGGHEVMEYLVNAVWIIMKECVVPPAVTCSVLLINLRLATLVLPRFPFAYLMSFKFTYSMFYTHGKADSVKRTHQIEND